MPSPRSATLPRSDAKAAERERRARDAEETAQLCDALPALPSAQVVEAGPLRAPGQRSPGPTQLSVVDQYSAAANFDAAALGGSVATLVFASAKNPGGGWRRGSRAQEEDLSLASTWGVQAERSTGFFDKEADWMGPSRILTAQGFWLRGADEQWLSDPSPATFIAVSAPNLSWARSSNEKIAPEKLQIALAERLTCALEWSASRGCDAFVGGLIGCGVFGWDPLDCAKSWALALTHAQRLPARVILTCPGHQSARQSFGMALCGSLPPDVFFDNTIMPTTTHDAVGQHAGGINVSTSTTTPSRRPR